MVGFRDQKRTARRILHSRMWIPANYYSIPNGPPTLIHVRLTTKTTTVNEASNRYGLAATETVEPKIIFMLDECDPINGAILSFEIDEAYSILAVDPPDDITVTAACIRLNPADAGSYMPPTPAV